MRRHRRKNSIPFDRHLQLGIQLRRTRDQFAALQLEIERHYPKRGPEARGVARTLREIDHLLRRMDERLRAEEPRYHSPKIYLGGEGRDR